MTTIEGHEIYDDDNNKKTDNIGDFNTSIFIGDNQNSYAGTMIKNAGSRREYQEDYSPNLPTYYTKSNGDKKITLTYFVCLLNSAITQRCQLVSIMCFPNGRLVSHYGSRPLRAGKNHGKTRYNFVEVPTFELLDGNKKRVRIIYKNPNMSDFLRDKLSFYLENFDPEIEE